MHKEVPCNCCGSHDARVVFEAGVAQVHRIVRCNQCGLLFANPRNQEVPGAEVDEFDEYAKQRIQKEEIQIDDYASTMRLLASLHPNRGKLLEIGSGFGYLLAEFRSQGWDVIGVDPFRNACKYAQRVHKLDARGVILEEAGIPNETFDVVIMNHVIEHMPDPLGSLREINRVLKRGGHLVIETPRYDTLMFKLLGRRERSLSCDGHFYFFTDASLKNLYTQAGFSQSKLWHTGRTLTLERLAWNFGVMSKSAGSKNSLMGLAKKLRLNKMRIHLNMHDIQRVCVQKI